jgi:hypothetical protein
MKDIQTKPPLTIRDATLQKYLIAGHRLNDYPPGSALPLSRLYQGLTSRDRRQVIDFLGPVEFIIQYPYGIGDLDHQQVKVEDLIVPIAVYILGLHPDDLKERSWRETLGPYEREHPLRVKHAFEDWLLSSLEESAELIQLYADLTNQEVTATLRMGYGDSDPELTYCFQPKTRRN